MSASAPALFEGTLTTANFCTKALGFLAQMHDASSANQALCVSLYGKKSFEGEKKIICSLVIESFNGSGIAWRQKLKLKTSAN